MFVLIQLTNASLRSGYQAAAAVFIEEVNAENLAVTRLIGPRVLIEDLYKMKGSVEYELAE